MGLKNPVSSIVQTILGGLTGATTFVPPSGRLCPATGTPVPTANVAAAGTVYFSPYNGNTISLYNGSQWQVFTFAELSNVLANSATGNAGPAAAVASKNYDLFVWRDSGTGTIYLTRGGAWNSDTARSATTENDLTVVNGQYVNLNAITNGPAAQRGLYVGTIRTDAGGATVSWHTGGSAAGGTAATLNVWNMFNRVSIVARVSDSTASWTYTSVTVRASDNSNGNRVSLVRGLDEESVTCRFQQHLQNAAAAGAAQTIWVGLDVTNAGAAPPASNRASVGTTLATALEQASVAATYDDRPGLGFHFLSANEASDGTNANTFFGGNAHHLTALVRA